MQDVKVIGSFESKFESTNRIYDEVGCSPTLSTMQGGNQEPKILQASSIRMVRTEEGKALRKQYENHELNHGFNEYREPELRKDGVTNTLSTVKKDNYVCVAMRGRNPDNPSDRAVGSPTEQRLEVNMQGTSNCLTSVQKDNLVMENPNQLGFMDHGTGKHQSNTAYDEKALCPNITTVNGGGTQQIKVVTQYRIRKLTPKECWRLMDFTDEDFEKAAEVNSNTQLYKQAGNSIVVNVLVAILGQLLPDKEDVYKEIND